MGLQISTFKMLVVQLALGKVNKIFFGLLTNPKHLMVNKFQHYLQMPILKSNLRKNYVDKYHNMLSTGSKYSTSIESKNFI